MVSSSVKSGKTGCLHPRVTGRGLSRLKGLQPALDLALPDSVRHGCRRKRLGHDPGHAAARRRQLDRVGRGVGEFNAPVRTLPRERVSYGSRCESRVRRRRLYPRVYGGLVPRERAGFLQDMQVRYIASRMSWDPGIWPNRATPVTPQAGQGDPRGTRHMASLNTEIVEFSTLMCYDPIRPEIRAVRAGPEHRRMERRS